MRPALHIPRTAYRYLATSIVLLCFALGINALEPSRADSMAITLTKLVSPTLVNPGQIVSYELTLTNGGTQALHDLQLDDRLPTGMAYVPGSTRITQNGQLVSDNDPQLAGDTWTGQELVWADLDLATAHRGSYYGMHTFVQDRCQSDDINYQLDRVRELMGAGAYVTQLFYRITSQTQGPVACWVDFVNRAYDRDLVPVIRLQGEHGGPYWNKPQADAPGNYTSIAQAYKRVVQGLPRRDGHLLYIEIWNEPNLNIEWSGAANATEYAEFLVDVAAAIRTLHDPRIVLLNGALSPGGDIDYLAFIDGMASVPGALQAFDVWASHPYPGNHPPEYNIHHGTAIYANAAIDTYLLELARLAQHGRDGLQVLLTETGYALYQDTFVFEGYPAISEQNRADYIKRAFEQYWRQWPEVLGVCPYELVDPQGQWWVWDWLYPDGRHHEQYDALLSLDKTAPDVPSVLTIQFQAKAPQTSGVVVNDATARSTAQGLTLSASASLTVRQPTATPSRTPTVTGTPPTATPTLPCADLARNGGFEQENEWLLNRAWFTDTLPYADQRSLLLGLAQGSNSSGYSSAQQTITLPQASSITLTYWWYPISSDMMNDVQTVRLLSTEGQLLELWVRTVTDDQRWLLRSHDLGDYAGQTVKLYFGVINDGQAGQTAMYVDNVRVLACEAATTATPTWTATPRPTTTPTPACQQLVRNGDLEGGGGWQFDQTEAWPARLTSDVTHGGQHALQVGLATNEGNMANYSSAWQTITIPASITNAVLSFWYWPVSDDVDHDRQYALIQGPAGEYRETILWGGLNGDGWVQRTHSLARYAGQTIQIYFGVHNDGATGQAALYIDDVAIEPCLPWTPVMRAIELPLVLKSPMQEGGPALPTGTRASPLVSSDAQGQRLYALDDGLLRLLDTSYNVLATVPVESQISDLIVGADGRVYLADPTGRQLLVWDADFDLVMALPLHTQPAKMALLDDTLYLTCPDRNQVWAIDVSTYEIVQQIDVGRAPYAIAVDPGRARIWVSNFGDGTITIMDRFDTNRQTVVSLGGLGYPTALVVDQAQGHGYVLYALSMKYAALARIDGDDLVIRQRVSSAELPALAGARRIALDDAGSTLYISTASGLTAMDAQQLTVQQTFNTTDQPVSDLSVMGERITGIDVTGRLFSVDK